MWTPVAHYVTSKDTTRRWQVDQSNEGTYRCRREENEKSRCPGLTFNPQCPTCGARLVPQTGNRRLCHEHGEVSWACRHILHAIAHPELVSLRQDDPTTDVFFQTIYRAFRGRFADAEGKRAAVLSCMRFGEYGTTLDGGRFKAFVDDLRLSLGDAMKTTPVVRAPRDRTRLGIRQIVLD
jgi:hypothetical protein